MRLVDARRLRGCGCGTTGTRHSCRVRIRTSILPLVLRLRHARREKLRLGILRHVLDKSRDAFAASPIPAHFKMVLVTDFDPVDRNLALPNICTRQTKDFKSRINLPTVEVADQPHRRRMRRPFAEHPMCRFASATFHAMKAEIDVRVRPIGKRSLAPCQFGCAPRRIRRATANSLFKRFQVRIVKQVCHKIPFSLHHYIIQSRKMQLLADCLR